ncbi:hypothetical protein C8Q74DRAFT_1255332 [Fomes fomentarius]|nr:hypothetical protein C8Q74DRAFT_1255332 [Fomes fomentarius]
MMELHVGDDSVATSVNMSSTMDRVLGTVYNCVNWWWGLGVLASAIRPIHMLPAISLCTICPTSD